MFTGLSCDVCGVQHVLNGATVVPLVTSMIGTLGPAAEGYLQNLATVACMTGVVDRGVWLRIACQSLSCALVVVALFSVTTTRVLQNAHNGAVIRSWKARSISAVSGVH
jgi:hypothetical protein